MKTKQLIHRYEGYNGAPSECRFTFHEAFTGATVVVVDELPINPGTPIREFSEHLATQAYRMIFPPNSSHLDEFIYIEHGPESAGTMEYVFTRVDFDWDDDSAMFIHPVRASMTHEEVQTLVGDQLPAA